MEVCSNETESSDIESRGSPISNLGDLWWKDPTQLTNISLKIRQPTMGSTAEFQVESKPIKEIITTTIERFRHVQ